jgi:TRAP-type mannitol/chloroaromatic compound transport system permease small subunit
MDAVRTGEHTGSGGWNPVVWPFRAVLFAGFLIFSLQIFAEILKRLAWLVGRPIETETIKNHGV